MKKTQMKLGASMYVPATREPANLVEIGDGKKYPALRSVIFCTEDAVREEQLPDAIRNLSAALPQMDAQVERPMRFIRARNPHILGLCMAMRGIENIDGFVLPKITRHNLMGYLAQFTDKDTHVIMPTLETEEAFDASEMSALRQMLQERAKGRVLCLRIGGNDLLNCLRLRRNPNRTIYETPIGQVIARLAGMFIPFGIGLTGPVCEAVDRPEVLREEVELDLNHGLFGKTVIHPDQIAIVEEAYAVSEQDLGEAEEILHPDAPAVFKRNGRMCEPTTHGRWAEDIIERSRLYGVQGDRGNVRRIHPRTRMAG